MKLNFFKPKAAKTDYSQSMLPQNRKQVFFDVVKLHWKELLLLGVILVLFSMPFLFSQIWQDSVTSSILQSLNEASTDEEVLAAYTRVATTENLRAFINVFFLMIYSIGFSGVMRVIRQYAWEENVHIVSDFIKGIKQNVGQNLITALVGGIIYALCVGIFNMASVSSGFTVYLLYFAVDISAVIVFPVMCYMTMATCVYSEKWRRNIKNSFAVFSKCPFRSLLAVICCVIIYVPQFIPNVYCHILGRLFSALLTPFSLLGWCLFVLNQFDKFINTKFFPSLVGKGTFSTSKEES